MTSTRLHPAKAARHHQGPPLTSHALEDLITDLVGASSAFSIVYHNAVRENARTNPESESSDVTIVMGEQSFSALAFAHETLEERVKALAAAFHYASGLAGSGASS